MNKQKKEQILDVDLGTLDEFYEECDGEPWFEHMNWHYEIAWGDEDGWDVYILPEKEYTTNRKWYETAPKEHFKDLCDLVFNLKLKDDGRTLAEYICDYQKIPRYAVPIPPKFINNPKRKH